jgi:hypothetical protein
VSAALLWGIAFLGLTKETGLIHREPSRKGEKRGRTANVQQISGHPAPTDEQIFFRFSSTGYSN